MTGITEATSMAIPYFDSATKLIHVIGTAVGFTGDIKMYGKFGIGNPDTLKVAASQSGACISLTVSMTILCSFLL